MAGRAPPGSSRSHYSGMPSPIPYQQVPTTPMSGGWANPSFAQAQVHGRPPSSGHHRAISRSTSGGSSAEIYSQQPMTQLTSHGVQTGQIGGAFGPYTVSKNGNPNNVLFGMLISYFLPFYFAIERVQYQQGPVQESVTASRFSSGASESSHTHTEKPLPPVQHTTTTGAPAYLWDSRDPDLDDALHK